MSSNISLHVSIDEIQAAQQELQKYLKPSPLLMNHRLSEDYGCEVYLKLENMMPIGSFKIRGATYKISQLSADEKVRGVIAASAGNHAQGVAWGSRKLGVSATIVMPRNAALVKVQSTQAYGAEVILDGENYDEAYAIALEIAKKRGKIFVHAFEDPAVIAGQGTVGLEIAEQLPGVDFVLGSVGGGGLISGVATALKALKPDAQVIACQAAGAASMVRSIEAGKAVKLGKVSTFADGVAVGAASERMYEVLKGLSLNRWVEADDEEIANAVLMLMEKGKVIAEGSGALPLACLERLKGEIHGKGKKVVVIVSGGNIDVNVLSRIIDRGLIRAGRRVRVNVVLQDRPGSLAHLTDLLAREGANILQAIHDRSEPSTTIDQTDVALTLETRGPEHSERVIGALRGDVIRVEVVH